MCVVVVTILLLCTFNGVAAAPVSKLTQGNHINHARDAREGGQQTYIFAVLGDEQTSVTRGVGQSIDLSGELAYGAPPTSSWDTSHGIAFVPIHIQNLNSDGKTWTTVFTRYTDPQGANPDITGRFIVTLTPSAAGVYNYRVTFDGDSQYAPAISNPVTLTVINVAVS